VAATHHESRVYDRVELATDVTCKHIANTIHGVNLGMVAFELSDDIATPCCEETNNKDD
jgi:hypothetical protein